MLASLPVITRTPTMSIRINQDDGGYYYCTLCSKYIKGKSILIDDGRCNMCLETFETLVANYNIVKFYPFSQKHFEYCDILNKNNIYCDICVNNANPYYNSIFHLIHKHTNEIVNKKIYCICCKKYLCK